MDYKMFSKSDILELEHELLEMAFTIEAITDAQAQKLDAVGTGIHIAIDAILSKFDEEDAE